ncbi:hypothetical protein G7Y89_g15079 [Cudoniella acicularis]|uniref:Uncharacterized protein n=1 Tax=Cudoniella acicularis TaxID=354080 RepID=A0A8H4VQX2_9HELO|nr:hypothetical protein G7Y89_g15079 [Cudoniella acicularis]
MLSKIVLILAAATSLSQAFQVPAGAQDGAYIYDTATNSHSLIGGNSTTVDVGPPSNFDATKRAGGSARLSERGFPWWSCSGTVVGGLDWASAMQIFKPNCDDTQYEGGQHLYAKYGEAMIFQCNYDASTCDLGDPSAQISGQVLWELSLVDSTCGSVAPTKKAGWRHISSSLSIGQASVIDIAC